MDWIFLGRRQTMKKLLLMMIAPLFAVACGSPQDKKNNQDRNIPDHGPEGGQELSLDADPLQLTPCLQKENELCKKQDELKFNSLGYEAENIKSVSKLFSLTAEQSLLLKIGEIKTTNLRCQFKVSATDDPAKPITVTLAESGGEVRTINLNDEVKLEEGQSYQLGVKVENVYHCNVNRFEFAVLSL